MNTIEEKYQKLLKTLEQFTDRPLLKDDPGRSPGSSDYERGKVDGVTIFCQEVYRNHTQPSKKRIRRRKNL